MVFIFVAMMVVAEAPTAVATSHSNYNKREQVCESSAVRWWIRNASTCG